MTRNKWLTLKLVLLVIIFLILSLAALDFIGLESLVKIQGEERTFQNAEKVVVETISLSVEVMETDGTEVTIKDNSRNVGFRGKKLNTLEQVNGVITFKQAKGGSFFNIVIGSIVVEVPRGTLLDYEINSISGSIDHDARSKETLQATSVSGAIRIYQGGEKANIKSTSGSVRIHSSFEECSAKSVSGSVRVVADEGSKEVVASSVSGSVRIQLDKVSGYTMDYSTTSGTIKDRYKNIKYEKSGKVESGDQSLVISTSTISGSINLMDWNNE